VASTPTASSSPPPSSPIERLGHAAYHRKWWIVGAWVAGLVAAGGLAATTGGAFADSFTIPGTESQAAIDLLEDRFPAKSGGSGQLVFEAEAGIDDPAITERIQGILADAAQLPGVTGVSSPYESPDDVSESGTIAFATVEYESQVSELPEEDAHALVELVEASAGDGLVVEVGGEIAQRIEQGEPGSSELIGIAAAAVILVIAFGSVIAMGVPIVVALVSLGGAIALITLLANFLPMSSIVTTFAAMIGLGVGIDYALLVITRFREGLHGGRTVEDAVAIAVGTAGRSVLFAGAVVMIAMLGLNAIGIPFVGGLGTAAAVVVGMTILAAMTLLPAVLSILGHRVDSWTIPFFATRETDHHRSIWYRLSIAIQRRPWLFAGAAGGFLLLLIVPVLSLETGFADAGNNDESLHSRRAYDLLTEGFGPGFNGPLTVVVDVARGGADSVDGIAAALADTPGVDSVGAPIFNGAKDTAIITLYPTTAPQADATSELVHHLRDTVLPAATANTGADAFVTGATAANIDFTGKVSARTPLFFAIVIGLSFVVLMMVFRSVVIPVTAAIMNLLSVGAAYGVLVAIFQWGWLAGPLGIDQTGPVEAFLPMMLFAILFGLSMDYEVFLVSRIREEHVNGADTSHAVAMGLSSTARVITCAALIMIAVFGSFVLGDERVIKMFGIGLATAIFIDATVVRLLLVPAVMELLGSANWWLPSKLARVLPHINVEGPAHLRPTHEPAVIPAPAAGD
jgi:RND superfamily putative drug exporter